MSGVHNTANDVDVDLGRLFSSLAKHWFRILVVSLVITGLALVFAWIATPRYMGETRLLIETRESVFTRPDTNNSSDNSPAFDEEGVISQVEVIGSTDILKRVAEKLNLSSLPEFDETADMSMLGRLLIMAGLKSDPNEIPPEERVLKAFRERLSVYRVEKSRVIVIEFSSEDPKLAAEVPNVLADTYLAVQRDAKLQSNSDATEWLEPEIADLRERVKEAESKVAAFRSKSDLLVGQNNSVLATQQLSELSTELSRVRANRAAAQANAQGVRATLESGASLDALPEVLSSGLIQRLRERQVQLKADIADLSTTLLDGHPRIRALNSQLADLDSQIRNEAEKVLKGLETEAKTALLRENQLIASLNTLKAESSRAGEEEVELRALEREAAAQRELLESYLTRYREASSRKERNYLPVDARVFSRAIVPSEPYFPKTVPIVGAAFAASLLIMAIVTLLQELFSGRAMRPAAGSRPQPIEQVSMPEPIVEPVIAEKASPTREAVAVAAAQQRAVAKEDSKASSLGEVTVETAAEKLIAGGAARAIFVSPEGDEAAAAAVMVAREVADAGLRVLLLDLTSNGAASLPMLESAVYPGITNLLASEAQFSDVIHADLYSDCHVIPLGTADPERAMRAADRLPIIMNSLTTAYDVVVVECGPADAEGIRRLVSDGTEILVSVIETSDVAVAETAADLAAGGYKKLTLVSPSGHEPPVSPMPDRSAA
ncbi:GumC family protein [Mesorhizobium sp. ZC-5]|uniref:GumC family protein n=1 Tax=Mesorhizobium sp. ZC-5 TaxID=2986066 RepID=UPI0021E7D098|nr:Wzz/FepE/Etk N-terminal domain-containing protein [Mesorhizobium sp. ZC-5]MCV3240341.1 Wzz/FepE/Etk N-terminal domain-containing protein [Mesorhizobium sp. ZC-5]